MNYKKLFKGHSLRFRILQLLSWVPDKWMIPLQYRIKTGRWPNLKSPQRFTEKLQVYKMRYHNPLMHQCVDKYEVRKYVTSLGLEHILVKLFGVYNNAREIDFSQLPTQFVIKTTDGGGAKCIDLQRFVKITD